MSYQSINDSGDNNLDIVIEKTPGESKATRNCVYITIGLVVIIVVCALIFVDSYDSSSSSSTTDTTSTILTKYAVTDSTAVCNDGSPSYYYYKSSPSKKWIIYFEGSQTFCHDQYSCDERWASSSYIYMTSSWYEDTREWSGLISTDPVMNPDWYDANIISIPSCSSDLYGGNATMADNEGKITYAFLGYRIVHSTLVDIMDKFDILSAEDVLVTGNGGGGVGTLIHLDHIHGTLVANGFTGTIKGVPDTSLMVDYPQYIPSGCTTTMKCPINESLQIAQEYWNSVSPTRCLAGGYEPWECYVGQYTLHTISIPMLCFQWLYETSQLTLLGVKGTPSAEAGTLDYANEIVDLYVNAFETELDVTTSGFFTPACFKHEDVNVDTWNDVGFDGYYLNDAIRDFWNGNPTRMSDTCRTPNCNPECVTA